MSWLACGIRSQHTTRILWNSSQFSIAQSIHQQSSSRHTISEAKVPAKSSIQPSRGGFRSYVTSNSSNRRLLSSVRLQNLFTEATSRLTRPLGGIRKISSLSRSYSTSSNEGNDLKKIPTIPSFDYPYKGFLIFFILMHFLIAMQWGKAQLPPISEFDRVLLAFLRRNFLCNLDNLQEGRVWTLITSVFNNTRDYQCYLNMAVIFFYGHPILAILGRGRFLGLYIASGMVTTATLLLWHQIDPSSCSNVRGDLQDVKPHFGLSGPTHTILTVGLLITYRIPLILVIAILAAADTALESIEDGPIEYHRMARQLPAIIVGALFWRFGLKRARYALPPL